VSGYGLGPSYVLQLPHYPECLHLREKTTLRRRGATDQEPGAMGIVAPAPNNLEWVNCGSPYCRECSPGSQGAHGPYLDCYLWRNGRHVKRYIGKTLP
jgi:hypothetical protein